jgi:moderate conductance mechanosensitive channel
VQQTEPSLLAQVEMETRRRLEWWEVVDLASLAGSVLSAVGSILIVLGLAWVAYRALGILLRRLERSLQSEPGTFSVQEQRAATLLGLGRSVGIVIITVISLFMVLSAIGVNIAPLLAGAGVIGLAISFGAQSLVRDILSGLFILFENQFGVGDVIRAGTVSGRVEKMTLRIVVLRDVHGTVHVVPNGEIKQVSNMTRSFSRAVFEIGVSYREDIDRVIAVMRDVGREMWEDPAWRPLLTEEIVVPGVESFGPSSVDIRIMATTIPMKQWDVARELRLRLKKRFDRERITIPFPHQTLYWGEGQNPREEGRGKGGESGMAGDGSTAGDREAAR